MNNVNSPFFYFYTVYLCQILPYFQSIFCTFFHSLFVCAYSQEMIPLFTLKRGFPKGRTLIFALVLSAMTNLFLRSYIKHMFHYRIRGRHIIAPICKITEHYVFRSYTNRQLPDIIPEEAYRRTIVECVRSSFLKAKVTSMTLNPLTFI